MKRPCVAGLWVLGLCCLAGRPSPAGAQPGSPSRTEFVRSLDEVVQLRRGGNYPEALRLALKLAEDATRHQGPNSLESAVAQVELASVYRALGRYSRAEPLLRDSLRILDKDAGKNQLALASCVNNLASLYQEMGEYARAEPLFQRGRRIYETSLRPDHPAVAALLNNLASLYQEMGQHERARALFQESLHLYEKEPRTNQAAIASCLKNLAALHQDMGRLNDAEQLFQRSLQTWKAQGQEDHEVVASVLSSLAGLYTQMGRYKEAEPLFLKSLRIYEKRLGKDHPAVAQSLHDLAGLYQALGKHAEAESHFQRGLAIREEKLGPDHPAVAQSLAGLALLAESSRQGPDQTRKAAQLYDRARRINRQHVALVLPSLSPSEQAHFLHHTDQAAWHQALSLGLRHADAEELVALSAAWLCNAKGVAHQTAARSALLARDSRGPDLDQVSDRLRDVRQRLARLTLTVPQQGQEKARLHELARLSGEEAQLAKELGKSGGRNQQPEPWIEQEQLQKALPADTVFIDIALFGVCDFQGLPGARQPDRYAAWITSNKGPVRLIDLGPAKVIDDAVALVRRGLSSDQAVGRKGEAEAEAALREPLTDLSRRVLLPLLPHIGKTAHWIISPDGNLWLVPWSALLLQSGKYAVEDHRVSYAVSGRDLVKIPGAGPVKPAAPLVLADPNFDLDLNQAAQLARSLLRDDNLDAGVLLAGRKARGRLGDRWDIFVEFLGDESFVLRFAETGEVYQHGRWSLKGNNLRIETVYFLYRGQLDGDRITGKRWSKDEKEPVKDWSLVLERRPDPLLAREETVRSVERLNRAGRLPYTAREAEDITPALRKYTGTAPRVLLENQALAPLVLGARHPRVLVLSTHGFFLPSREAASAENPLLRCGLLFAGCNNAARAAPGQDTGVLTGLQIVGTDLRGCELVVLSACETALGDVRSGEGVAGLRQAFQLAGTQSVVATLWQVNDAESAQLMIRFWENLAAGQNKAEALRQAQLALIKARRDRHAAAHPFYWAAFTLTGAVK